MDNLALNIFVPENKPGSKGAKKKQKTSQPPSTKFTEVKSFSKSPGFPKTKIEQNNIDPSSKSKKSKVVGTKVTKEVGYKPFLVSEKFNTNENTGKETKDDSEPFSVSFVKPKLFQKMSKPTITNAWGSAKPNGPDSKEEPAQKPIRNKGSKGANDTGEFKVGFVKPRLFQKKSDAGKGTATASKMIQKADSKNEPDSNEEPAQKPIRNKEIKGTNDTEEFKVGFVKPKLFQNKSDSGKGTATASKSRKIIQKADSKNDGDSLNAKASAAVGNGVVDLDDDFSEGFNSNSGERKLNKNRGSALFKEGAWKSEKYTNKWFSNPSDQNGKIHIDFSTTKDIPAKNKPKKIDEGDVDFSTNKDVSKNKHKNMGEGVSRKESVKRKLDCSNNDVEKKRRREDFGAKELPNPVGPVSSLFSYDIAVEPLEETDVQPLEERLFSRKTFKDVGIHPHLVGNLEQLFGITNMTVVQKKTIPELMNGKDGLVRSQTGSGKTLAYAIPIMHSLQQVTPKLTRKDGVKALIVLPTRELALQTYECFTKLMRAFTWIVPGIVVGGEKRKSEKVRLRKGITVLIGTPGRLLDHAEHSENLSLHGIDWLIIDEADKLLEMGYEKDISQLMSIIDSQREKAEIVGRKQTVLLSATLTSSVEKLANLALKDPAHIDACSNVQETTDVMTIPQTLEQKYVVVPAKMRLVALASFIVEVTELRKSNKVLVFMATQDMVDFYMDLIPSVLSSTVKFFKLHGNMSQGDRTEVFNAFRKSDKGVLLSTDVAARGLDLPMVDWIVQYTAPTTPAEYVHRVGRTARVGTTGSSLLFLLPSELHFVSMLNSSRIKLDEVNIDIYLKCLMKIHLESRDGQRWGGGIEGAATVLQHNFEHAVMEDKTLHEIACKAYKSWVRFYATYPKDLRVVFDFKSLHLGHNAKSFALRDPPRAIGGIGKPKKGEKWGKGADMRPIRKRKTVNLGHITQSSRTKKLILSEFDSGLKPLKKMK